MGKTIDRGALAIMLGLSTSLLAGCGQPDAGWRVCSDPSGRRLPDRECQQGGGYYGAGRWLYLRGGGAPRVGDPIAGGFLSPPSGGRFGSAPIGGVARGGFGGLGRGEFGGFGHFGFGG